jgi:RNA polymerase sigma-70 factor (ECF subfamily)
VGTRDTSDDDVIAAAKQGDQEAWRTLYAHVGGRLVAWVAAQSVIDAALDAEDVANETWLTAARRVAEFTGDRDAFAGWLFVIARNITVNANRRSLRRDTMPTAQDPRELTAHQSEDVGDATASRDQVRRLLAMLTERERDVVACIDVAGLDAGTTGHVLGISRTSVRVAHHRAIKRLQSLLAADASPPP